jgi:hypothetical protein
MTELSPAAQAVLDAALPHMVHRYSVAAALRAAVTYTQDQNGYNIWICDADDLLAIANELEAK